MVTKSVFLSTLTGFISLFLLGWLFYQVIAVDFFNTRMNIAIENAENIAYITLGTLLQSYAFCLIYRCFTKNYGLKSGAYFGSLIGFFVGFGIGLLMYGTSALMILEAHLVDAFWNVAYYGLTGMLVGLTFKLTSPRKTNSETEIQ